MPPPSMVPGDRRARSRREESPPRLVLLSLLSPKLHAQTLDLPPRPPDAPKGAEFARSIAGLPLKEREEAILAEVKTGNVPPFLRTFVPVEVTLGAVKATYFVAPDYLAIGSDDDYFLTPITPEHRPEDRRPAGLHAADAEDGG